MVLSTKVISQLVDQVQKTAPRKQYLQVLSTLAELLRGSIHVEDVYMKFQIARVEALQADGQETEAAAISEQLASDTAMSVPYETRLFYILQQIRAVNKLGNPVRSLLIFQKYNDATAKREEQTTNLQELRAQVYLEMASVHKAQRDMLKLANCLFQAAISYFNVKKPRKELFEEALVAAFACQKKDIMQQIIDFQGFQEQSPLKAIIASKFIQDVKALQHVQPFGMEQQLRAGFIQY